MRVGWLQDDPGYVGGAELTAAEFRKAAPEGVEVVDCPAGDVVRDLDRYVCHNIRGYAHEDMVPTAFTPIFKVWHDVGRVESTVAHYLHDHATNICCSPAQREFMGLDAEIIPPAMDLAPFRRAAVSAQERIGAVSVGSWMNPGKAPDAAAEWAAGNGGIDFYGGGWFAPEGSKEVAHEDLPAILARYETFVHLPRVIEPFGRTVAEAWAAGCAIVVNDLVGAKHFILNDPGKLDTAASDFWSLILG